MRLCMRNVGVRVKWQCACHSLQENSQTFCRYLSEYVYTHYKDYI